ncbi:MAG: type II toxin-antitoxin system ParD family antitoxin [Caulobacteraceae bacterium]
MQTAEKLSITITPEMAKTVRQSVQAGEYGSTSEVIREALRLWANEREERAERLAAIKARIKAAIDDPRPSIPVEEAFDFLRDRLETIREQKDEAA